MDWYAAISLYTFLGCGCDGLACLATSMIDLQIAPHFSQPFFSESFSSMWGRRWNMSVGNTLRILIYEPIQEGEGAGSCLVSQCRPCMAKPAVDCETSQALTALCMPDVMSFAD